MVFELLELVDELMVWMFKVMVILVRAVLILLAVAALALVTVIGKGIERRKTRKALESTGSGHALPAGPEDSKAPAFH